MTELYDVNAEDLPLDPVTDATGKELSDQDVIDDAERVAAVHFEHDGMKFMTYVRKIQVQTKQWNRITSIQAKVLFKAGFTIGEDPSKVDSTDERLPRFVEFLNDSESLQEAKADIAASASVRTSVGGFATNVPQLKKANVTGADILALGELGDAYITAVNEYLRPTSTPGEAGATPTNPANDTESSEPLSSMSQETSPTTG